MLRPARADEASAVGAVIDAAYQHYIPIIGRVPRPMKDDHAARIARGEHFVFEEDGRLVGVITLADGTADALHIFNIAVHPDAQGRGLLRTLLAFAEDQAHQRGLQWLTLYTNVLMARNRAIYAHLGFIELREEESEGYSIVFMERPVPAA